MRPPGQLLSREERNYPQPASSLPERFRPTRDRHRGGTGRWCVPAPAGGPPETCSGQSLLLHLLLHLLDGGVIPLVGGAWSVGDDVIEVGRGTGLAGMGWKLARGGGRRPWTAKGRTVDRPPGVMNSVFSLAAWSGGGAVFDLALGDRSTPGYLREDSS